MLETHKVHSLHGLELLTTEMELQLLQVHLLWPNLQVLMIQMQLTTFYVRLQTTVQVL